MAKKLSSINSIWNVIERNEAGETKVLTVQNGRANHHIIVYTSPQGISTSCVAVGEFEWPQGEIKELPVGEPS